MAPLLKLQPHGRNLRDLLGSMVLLAGYQQTMKFHASLPAGLPRAHADYCRSPLQRAWGPYARCELLRGTPMETVPVSLNSGVVAALLHVPLGHS